MEDSSFSFNLQEQFSATSPSMQFEPIHEGPAKIKVIGVGGGGGNAVNHMYRQGIHGVEFIVCNTDAKALEASPVPNKIVLGTLGAGNVPERARQLALVHKDEIRQAISDDTQMLFITAGMGGGTGTGAAPIIAEIAKSIELDDEMVKRILVVAIVTEPFSFEGRRRREQAQAGIEELKKYVDAILVINNDKLRKFGNVSLKEAFSQADDVLLTAAKGIAEIITVSAYVNIDFRDVNTVMENSGTALMGAGEGKGEKRAIQAIEEATTSVLLNDNDIRGAQNILLYFSCSPEHQITMDELGEVTDYLTELTGNNGANVIWGIGDDDSLNDEIRITLIATGFEPLPGRIIHVLPPESVTPDPEPTDVKPVESKEEEKPQPQDIHEEPVDDSGIHMVHKNPNAAATKTEASTTVVASAAGAVQTQQSSGPVSVPISDNPFDSVEASKIDGKRRITIEMPSDVEVDTLEKVRPTKEPVFEAQNHLDDIRVIKREVKTSEPQNVIVNNQIVAEQPKETVIFTIEQPKETVARTVEQPKETVVRTIEQPRETVVHTIEPPKAHVVTGSVNAPRPQTPSYADQQLNRALNPQSEEQKIIDRAERIRKINELLRNDPDGPRKVESIPTDQLTSEPIYYTNHSSESDAARTTIDAFGTLLSNMSFLEDLPD